MASVTLVMLEGGQCVRAGEDLQVVADLFAAALETDGWVTLRDPGDERMKWVRVDRVAWLEEEPE